MIDLESFSGGVEGEGGGGGWPAWGGGGGNSYLLVTEREF